MKRTRIGRIFTNINQNNACEKSQKNMKRTRIGRIFTNINQNNACDSWKFVKFVSLSDGQSNQT
jgi:hypothetical protein